ncbi:MAG: universal stress protein [Pseudomonadota bacterium]
MEGSRARRKFLVIIDETPECEQALLYAARRAERTGATVLALNIIAETEFQHWLGVENLMREEAEEEANALLDKAFTKLTQTGVDEPERKIITGNRTEGIRKAIAQDPAIAVLVLAAAPGADGPGPLISSIATGQSGAYPIPITIVPGGLSREEIEAIA